MIFYRLNERRFSRRWRRNKNYLEKDLRHLARRYRCQFKLSEDGIRITSGTKVVATFRPVVIEETKPEPDEHKRVYAALKSPVPVQGVDI